MRRLLSALLIAFILCGCAPVEYETVRDAVVFADPGDAPYEITIRVPPEAAETERTDAGRVYAAENGDYTITTRTLAADGLDAAVYALAGGASPQHRLTLGDGNECRLAWRIDTDGGPVVCRALCRMDGGFCYCLCLEMREGLGARYNDMINELFSSFSLTLKESADIPPARSR